MKKFISKKYLAALALLILPLTQPAWAAEGPLGHMQNAAAGTGLEGKSLPQITGAIAQGAIGLVGVIFLVLTIYAGISWMLAGGDEAKVKKAKGIIVAALTGLIITLMAYGITTMIINAIL
ncbi:MAG: hypothetical protein WC516_03105 [Patescibacteria group bacterium]